MSFLQTRIRFSVTALSWFVPLLIALLFLFPIHTIPVSPDGAYYAGQAFNLLENKGLTYMDGQAVFHRPLFPVILATVYMLFGKAPIVGYFVVKLFALCNILLVWLLARELFGSGAAITASLLVATSYRLNEWSGWLNLDFVLPFFLLIFFVAVFQGIDVEPVGKKRILWLFVAGLAMGCAALVKELALLFLPLPILYGALLVLLLHPRTTTSSTNSSFIPNTDDNLSKESEWRSILRQSGCIYLTFVLALSPGIIYSLWNLGNPILIFGSTYLWASEILLSLFTSSANESAMLSALLDRLSLFAMAPAYYFGWQLLAHFIIAPLFIPATIYLLVSAWRGSRSALFWVCSIGLFFPMIILQGIAGFRERQGLIVMYLFIIGLAALCMAFYRLMRKKIPQTTWGLLAAIFPIITIIMLQSSWDMAGNFRLLLHRMNIFSIEQVELANLPISAPQPWWSTEITIFAAQQLTQWIDKEKLAPGTKFFAFEEDARYLHFLTEGRYQFHTIHSTPVDSSRDFEHATDSSNRPMLNKRDAVLVTLRPPNALLSWRVARNQALPFYQVHLYHQSTLLQTIAEKQIDYIVIGSQDKWLAAYFLLHPDFRKLAEFEYGTVHLFAVLNQTPQTISIPPFIEQEVIDFLAELAENEPTRYAAIANKIFIHELGLEQETLSFVKEIIEQHLVNSHDFGYEALAHWMVRTESWSSQEFEEFIDVLPPADSFALFGAMHLFSEPLISEKSLELAAEKYKDALDVNDMHWPAALLSVRLCSRLSQGFRPTFATDELEHICSHNMLSTTALNMSASGRKSADNSLLDDALSVYISFIEEMPKNTHAYMQLASAYQQLNKMEMSVSVFEQAIKNDAATAELYFAYSNAAEKLWTEEQYRKVLQDGIRIATWDDPAYAPLKNKLAELE